MEKVTLIRLDSSDHGTFGRLYFKNKQLFSGELPERGNRNNISCIPAGIYKGIFELSPRFKRFMYGIAPVKNRSGIRIHSANFCGDDTLGFKRQLNGCISLGEKLGWMDGQKAILISSPAVRLFETEMNRQPFILEIINGMA